MSSGWRCRALIIGGYAPAVWPFSRRRSAADDDDAPEFCGFLGDPDAERLRFVLRKRDWDTARVLLSTTDAEHREYYVRIAAGTLGIDKWISGPIREEPGSALPLLVKAVHMVTWAWDLPGAGTRPDAADAGTAQERAAWTQRFRQADELLDEVLELDPRNADAWAYKLEVSRALRLPQVERWRRFERLIEIAPDHWGGHEEMLHCLLPHWGGNNDALFDFARTRARARPGTHIPTLVVLAHLQRLDELNRAIVPARPTVDHTYLEQEKVTDEIWDAAQLSVWHDDYRPTLLTPIAWNNFAYALTIGEQFNGAWDLFDSIGDDWITSSPWDDMKYFLICRDQARESKD
jgi:hypothetical protein